MPPNSNADYDRERERNDVVTAHQHIACDQMQKSPVNFIFGYHPGFPKIIREAAG
jgi:hypothetical protein